MAVDADNDGCNICTPVRVITELSSLKERSVKKILSQLRAKNVLVVEEQGVHHTANNYSINLPALGIKRAKAEAPDELKQIMEDTWLAYPESRRVSKRKTFTALLKAYKEIEPSELLERTKAYADSMNGNARYAPHSFRWFEQGRYNDQPSTWRGEDKQEIKPYQ